MQHQQHRDQPKARPKATCPWQVGGSSSSSAVKRERQLQDRDDPNDYPSGDWNDGAESAVPRGDASPGVQNLAEDATVFSKSAGDVKSTFSAGTSASIASWNRKCVRPMAADNHGAVVTGPQCRSGTEDLWCRSTAGLHSETNNVDDTITRSGADLGLQYTTNVDTDTSLSLATAVQRLQQSTLRDWSLHSGNGCVNM